MSENPFRDYDIVSIPYGDADKGWTDDELTVDALMEDADGSEEYHLSTEEQIGLGLEISQRGLDGSRKALEGSDVVRYEFGDEEVYVITHRDSLVIAGEKEAIRRNIFAEYLEP